LIHQKIRGVLLLSSSLSFTGYAVQTQTQVLSGHVPAAISQSQRLGSLPESTRLRLSIGLPLRNREALTGLLEELYDPASPRFRQFLSSAEFTDQFGPTEKDYSLVVSFMSAHGFTIAATHPNRMILEVTATAGVIERAFHLRLG